MEEVLQMCMKEKQGVNFRRGWSSGETVSYSHLHLLRRRCQAWLYLL